jgi:hypothetical protein
VDTKGHKFGFVVGGFGRDDRVYRSPLDQRYMGTRDVFAVLCIVDGKYVVYLIDRDQKGIWEPNNSYYYCWGHDDDYATNNALGTHACNHIDFSDRKLVYLC